MSDQDETQTYENPPGAADESNSFATFNQSETQSFNSSSSGFESTGGSDPSAPAEQSSQPPTEPQTPPPAEQQPAEQQPAEQQPANQEAQPTSTTSEAAPSESNQQQPTQPEQPAQPAVLSDASDNLPPQVQKVEKFLMKDVMRFILFPFTGLRAVLCWLIPQAAWMVVEFVVGLIYLTGKSALNSAGREAMKDRCSYTPFLSIYLLIDAIVWAASLFLYLILGSAPAALLLKEGPPSILQSPFNLINAQTHPAQATFAKISFVLFLCFRIFNLGWSFAGMIGLSALQRGPVANHKYYCYFKNEQFDFGNITPFLRVGQYSLTISWVLNAFFCVCTVVLVAVRILLRKLADKPPENTA